MRRALMAVLLLAGSSVSLPGQAWRRIPPIGLIDGSTRAMGMGGAFVAGDGPEVLYANPAQLTTARGIALAFERTGGEASYLSLTTGTALLGLSMGTGMQMLEFRASPWRPGTSPRGPAREVGASSMAASLGAALERRGSRVGVTVRYLQQHLDGGRIGVPVLDLGAATQVRRVTVGIAATQAEGLDFGRGSGRLQLPTRLTLGASMPQRPIGTWFDLGGAVSLSGEAGGRLVPAGGLELSYLPVSGWNITVRAGARGHSGYRDGQPSPLSVGGSVSADRLTVDYALVPGGGGMGASHRVGLRVRP